MGSGGVDESRGVRGALSVSSSFGSLRFLSGCDTSHWLAGKVARFLR